MEIYHRRGVASRKPNAMMNRLLALFSLAVFVVAIELTGCSSKQEEVAVAPPTEAPIATSNDDAVPDAAMVDSGEQTEPGGADASTDTQAEEAASPADAENPAMVEEPVMVPEPEMASPDASANPSGDGSGQSEAPAKPKNLREQAEQAFGDGQEKAAYRLIQAHLLCSSADAPDLLSHYRWSTSRRQPQLGARIAVGVVLKAPSDAKDFKPIGSLKGLFKGPSSKGKNRNNANGENPDGAGDNANGATLLPTESEERVLQKYTGLMGDVLVNHLRAGHTEGKWAPVFQANPGVGNRNTNLTGGESDSNGEAGTITAKWPLDTKINADEAKYVSVGPTLTYIGTESAADLLELAKAGAFDCLIVFDVEVTINLRVRMIYNECRARLVNLTDGKTLASSKLLKNTEVQKELDESGLDVIETAMKPFLAKLDEKVAMIEIPTFLTAEMIKTKRLGTLVSDESRPKLESLTEIRLYQNRSLLEDDDVNKAFETILGPDDGKLLATGSDEERLNVVKKLLIAP